MTKTFDQRTTLFDILAFSGGWLEGVSDDDKRNLTEPTGELVGLIHRQELKEYFKREVHE